MTQTAEVAGKGNYGLAQEEDFCYLKLDFSATLKACADHMRRYNRKMKKLHGDQHRKYTIKSTHLHTLEKMLYKYRWHCANNKQKRLPPNRFFTMTRPELARLFETECSEKRITEHWQRLEEARFFRVRHRGPDAGPVFTFNPSVLVPEIGRQERLFLENTGVLAPDSPKISEVSFSVGYTGKITNSHQYILPETLHETTKKKNGSGIPSADRKKPENPEETDWKAHLTAQLNPCSGSDASNDLTRNFDTKHGSKLGKSAETPPFISDAPAKKHETFRAENSDEKPAPQELGSAVFFTEKMLIFLLKTLYPDQNFAEQVLTGIREQLHKILSPATTAKGRAEIFGIFAQVVIFKRYHLDLNPETFMPGPVRWLDPGFSYGYISALEYYRKEIIPKRQKFKQYYSNVKSLKQWMLMYERAKTCDEKLQLVDRAEKWLAKARDGQRLLKIIYDYTEHDLSRYRSMHMMKTQWDLWDFTETEGLDYEVIEEPRARKKYSPRVENKFKVKKPKNKL